MTAKKTPARPAKPRTRTQAITKAAASPAPSWLVIAAISVGLLLSAAGKIGWLTPEQVDQGQKIKDAVIAVLAENKPEKTDETKEKITVETTTIAAAPQKVTAVSAESEKITDVPPKHGLHVASERREFGDPDFLPADVPAAPVSVAAKPVEHVVGVSPDLKDIIDQLLPFIIDWFKTKPKPNPQPDPPPNPQPVPPGPNPQPPTPPAPGTLRIIVSDETGKAVTAATVDAGSLHLVTCSTSGVGWQNSKHGTVRLAALPNGLGYALSLDSGAWCEFFATDYAGKSQTSLRITANQGPRPGPNPEPAPPQPDPNPQPPTPQPTNRTLALIVFSDLSTRQPETTKILMSNYWNGLGERHRTALYLRSTNESVGKAFLAETAGATGDVLLIRDDDTSKKLAVIPMPKTETEMEAALKAWSSR